MDEIERAGKHFAILDYFPVGACILRNDFVVLFWNRALEDWTGIPRANIVGANISAHYPHLSDQKYSLRIKGVLDGGPPTIFSSQLHGHILPSHYRDGHLRMQHVTVTAIHADSPGGFYALLSVEDVTDLTHRINDYRAMRDKAIEEIRERRHAEQALQKAREELETKVRERTAELLAANKQLQKQIDERLQAEKALKESEEKYRTLFEESRDAIYITTREGAFVDVNQSALDLFGYTRGEMLTINAEQIYHNPGDRDKFKQEVEQEGSVKDYEVRCRKKDGTIIDCLLTATLRRDQKGTIIGYHGIFRDVTERRRLEEEMLRVRKLEAIGILAGGIAHDFNNLLTAILGNISLARINTSPGDDLYVRLAEAERATIRAKDLTRQLLTFSIGGEPVKKKMAIDSLIKNWVTFALAGSKIRCVFSIATDLLPVDVDEGQLSQVINNIVINAQQAMPEGGTIRVEARNVTVSKMNNLPLTDGMYILISITDQGSGIPEEYLEKIFDPYFTTKEDGSGLGLASSYSIVKSHHGCITVNSLMGQGSTFSVYLPVSSSPDTVTKEETEDTLEGSRGKVLIMDDEEMIRAVAGTILSRIGYETAFAKDGEEAIALYRDALKAGNPFSAVIMDLTIPGGMGGKEAIQELIKIDPQVKAIVSSGYSNDTIMSEFRSYGFKGVVGKPYTIREIREVLHAVIHGEHTND